MGRCTRQVDPKGGRYVEHEEAHGLLKKAFYSIKRQTA
jgi:hypothetical protein